MQQYNYNNLQEFLTGWTNNTKYFEMLSLMAQLSRLFSESDIPYLDYRLAENLFCRYYDALNDARSCTAYDARILGVGIGIKTFILNKKNKSMEKIAEFNKLKKQLEGYEGLELACKLGEFRNDRMRFANNAFNVNETIYHVVGRTEGLLRIFNCPYEEIDVNNITLGKDDAVSITFDDGKNEYSFNKSKSVLMKRFEVPIDFRDVNVQIIDNPLELLEDFFVSYNKDILNAKRIRPGVDYVMLPLYSVRQHDVAPKSGLNQWNAGGRPRHIDEVYIPIPKAIHDHYPDFFPPRDYDFTLYLPDGNSMSAKVCQADGKALMSNPNRSLGEWILRKVLEKKPGELVTMDDLNRYGFDSVCIENLHTIDDEGRPEYRISFAEIEDSYNSFVGLDN